MNALPFWSFLTKSVIFTVHGTLTWSNTKIIYIFEISLMRSTKWKPFQVF
jgi:hypothetical protein